MTDISSSRSVRPFALLTIVFVFTIMTATTAHADDAWPESVEGFKAPAGGEHPRLLFRKTDLPALKNKTQTPEGRAIIARLKYLLGGGEAMPTVYNPNPPINIGPKGPAQLEVGAFTVNHAAGFGLLYQLTGDWTDGSHIKVKQDGNDLEITFGRYSKKKTKTATIEGRKITLPWNTKTTLTATVSDDAQTVFWSNGGTWTRVEKTKGWAYQPGDKVKTHAVSIGGQKVHLVTFAEDGNHPEPEVNGHAITLGGQTITLRDGNLELAAFTPAE